MLQLAESLIKQANTVKDNATEVPMGTILETWGHYSTGTTSYKSKFIVCPQTGKSGIVLRMNRKYYNKEARIQHYKDTGVRAKHQKKYHEKNKEKKSIYNKAYYAKQKLLKANQSQACEF